jgi:hypothetical protein
MSAYLIPIRLLNLLRSIFPPLLASIQRIRLRGDCDRLVISGWPLTIELCTLSINDYVLAKGRSLMHTDSFHVPLPGEGIQKGP